MYSYSESLRQSSQFQNLITNAFEKLHGSELETISLILEDDHLHMLLESMKEAREGKIVSFQSAFSDLD